MNKYSLFAFILSIISLSSTSFAEIITQDIEYRSGDTLMKGMIAYDDATEKQRPGILIIHEWWGHNDYARMRASMLAEKGYTALAVDMYGDGKTADHPEQASEFSSAVATNLPIAKARFEAALNVLQRHKTVDKDKVAAIGYCFGGGIVLQMARLGLDLDGFISYHGSIATQNPAKNGQVKGRILVFNGADDPFVKPEQISQFKQEMAAANVDYEFINYPGVKHSFTNKEADIFGEKFSLPLAYNQQADTDSWNKTLSFFNELFE